MEFWLKTGVGLLVLIGLGLATVANMVLWGFDYQNAAIYTISIFISMRYGNYVVDKYFYKK